MDNNNILNETFVKHLGFLKEKLQLEQEPTVPTPTQPQADPSTSGVDLSQSEKNQWFNDIGVMKVSDFVAKYGSKFSDDKFKAFVSAGIKDANPNDEKFTTQEMYPEMSSLIPTQNEIGFGNSLDDIIGTSKFAKKDELIKLLQGTNVALADKSGPAPIIIFAGKYIIDGHHRWSKSVCANPSAKVLCLNFNNPNFKENDIHKVLISFQIAVGLEKGNLQGAPLSGKNLMSSNKNDVYAYVEKNITPDFTEIYKQNKSDVCKDVKTTAGYVSNNAGNYICGKKAATSTQRPDMPQLTAGSGEKMKSGEINVLPDTASTTQSAPAEAPASPAITENILNKTFDKHTNLLKEYFKKK